MNKKKVMRALDGRTCDADRQEYIKEATILLKRLEKLTKEMYSFNFPKMEIKCSDLEAVVQRLRYVAKVAQYGEEIYRG